MRWIVRHWGRSKAIHGVGAREVYWEKYVGWVEAGDRSEAEDLARRRWKPKGRGVRLSVVSAPSDRLNRHDEAVIEANQKRAVRRGELTFGGLRSCNRRIRVRRDMWGAGPREDGQGPGARESEAFASGHGAPPEAAAEVA